MATVYRNLPLTFKNNTGKTIAAVWTGHHTNKDNENGIAPQDYYYRGGVLSGDTKTIGDITLISGTDDYWSFYYMFEDDSNLYGYKKPFEKKASHNYIMFRYYMGQSQKLELQYKKNENDDWKEFASKQMACLT